MQPRRMVKSDCRNASERGHHITYTATRISYGHTHITYVYIKYVLIHCTCPWVLDICMLHYTATTYNTLFIAWPAHGNKVRWVRSKARHAGYPDAPRFLTSRICSTSAVLIHIRRYLPTSLGAVLCKKGWLNDVGFIWDVVWYYILTAHLLSACCPASGPSERAENKPDIWECK